MLPHLSTSTPASEISRADFEAAEARNDMVGNSEETAVPSMADILRNSPAAELLGLKKTDDESQPEDTKTPAPEKSDEEVEVPSETSDDAETASDEEQTQEETTEEQTDEDDQESTQEADLPTEDQIDWEYKIPIKIDGKVEYKTLEEVRKGFATDQHLSQKGRELGEARKTFEQERTQKLNEIVEAGTIVYQELMASENAVAKEYTDLEAKIEEARKNDDTYTLRELKDKREELKEQYWKLRNKREEGAKKIAKQIADKQEADRQALLENFAAEIPKYIPEFDKKTANSIREFALKEGIPAELLEQVYDARVVKVLNDYRLLKTAKETGVAKRKSAPVAKSVPAKKGPTPVAKEKRQESNLRSKVLSGQGSKDDQTQFLKSISSLRHKL